MATVVVEGGSGGGHTHSSVGLWVALGSLASIALVLTTTSVGTEADALYWYELGKSSSTGRANAIAHLKTLAKTAKGSALTLIDGYIKDLQKLGATSTTKSGSSGSGS